MTLSLYDYQEEAVQACVNDLEETQLANIIMACGLGKTVVCAKTIERLYRLYGRFKVLFICDNKDILEQAAKEFKKWINFDISVGFYHGFEKTEGDFDITLATFQSLYINLDIFHADTYDMVVVDEAHHAFAPTYWEVLKHFTPLFSMGMTATHIRMDGFHTEQYWGRASVNMPLEWAIAQGHLPKLLYHMKLMDLDESKLNELVKQAQDVDAGKVSMTALNKHLFIEKQMKDWAKDIKIEMVNHDKVLVFCSSIEHCELMAKCFDNGQAFHGGNKQFKKSPEDTLDRFRKGHIKILFVVDKLGEGIHVKGVTLLVMLRITDSSVVWLQHIGRGLTGGCEQLTVLDYVGNLERLLKVEAMKNRIKSHDSKPCAKDSITISGQGYEFVSDKKQSHNILQKVKRVVQRLAGFGSDDDYGIQFMPNEELEYYTKPYHDQTAERADLMAAVWHAVEQLEKNQRDAIRLRYIEHMTYKQIGETIERSTERARNIITEGIECLRRVPTLKLFIHLN